MHLKSSIFALSFAPLGLASLANAEGPAWAVADLRCEGLESPPLVDAASPRFSWSVVSDRRSARQAAYQVRLVELDPAGRPSDETLSPRVDSDQCQWVEIPGAALRPKTRYRWQVRAWDETGRDSGWSDWAHFETSLMGTDWKGQWLSDGRAVENKSAPPARYFRKEFALESVPARARLYLSAYGLAEPWVNGSQATKDLFLPGWPDYRKRNLYVAYDVTGLLRKGSNALGIVLGDGWYSGTLFLGHQYGATPMVSGWIEIVDTAGATRVVATDETWQWSEGPIRANGIYFGETYDARRESADWSRPGGGSWAWEAAKLAERPAGPLEPRISQPVRRIQELEPIERRETAPGVFVYDLGQNMVGWVRLKVRARRGQEVQLRFAEMLDSDGGVYTKNLREADATARYIAKGEGIETWEPTFTFFGFRYVELSGLEEPLEDAITGVVAHTDLPRTGFFECSNPLLNQLYSNTLWGQKGNFLEIPTDCPQRDERLGWTGDAQVFCNTAHYNYASGAFYRQWLAAVRDSFEDGPDGGYGSVAPYTGSIRGSAGWADGGAIVPWVTWLHTADRKILEENYATLRRWIALLDESAPEGIRISKQGWGDWLAPGYEPKHAPTPYVLIATAYFAYSTQLAAEFAEELGRDADAKAYWALRERVKDAFQEAYIDEDGKILSGEQTAYLLALGFDLVSEASRPKMIKHLEAAIAEKDFHLSTGFIGTPLLAPVLTEVGLTDLAYKVVLQETYPGWLFSVKNGATTIWERWDSWTPEVGFNPGGMNSFNHYAYGSVVAWFYDTIAGIGPDPEYPGWKRFKIEPQPGGGLTYAKASVETPYGLVSSDWRIDNDRFSFEIAIPANTQARVSFPSKSIESTLESGKPIRELSGATHLTWEDGRVSLDLGAGRYQFSSPN